MNRNSLLPFEAPSQATTQASGVFDRLRADLLSGRLEPGRKLPMRFLTDTYQTGQTPLREALNRLSAEGLVNCHDQRGFYVAGISQEELAELTKTRCWVEALALRQSMAASTPAWEEALVLAHHRLAKTPRSLNAESFEDNPEWERQHQTYHVALIGQCGSQSLIQFCRQLYDRLYRYRQLAISKSFPSRRVADEHKLILDAVLAGDAERAVALLTQHYVATAEIIQSDAAIFTARRGLS
jgi:DNA-binding GntR family transcriptional regulator